MVYFIDVQGFKGAYNSFIVKEIAILNDRNECQHFIVHPPYNISNLPPDLHRKAYNTCQNHHGLDWTIGFSPLDAIIDHFSGVLNSHTIYVKGAEKVKWIKDLFRLGENANVQNLDEKGCPRIENMRRTYPDISRCIVHQGTCALQNVYLCKKFYSNM